MVTDNCIQVSSVAHENLKLDTEFNPKNSVDALILADKRIRHLRRRL